MRKFNVKVTMKSGAVIEREEYGNTAENIYDIVKEKAFDINDILLVELEEIPERKVVIQATLARPGENFETYEFTNDTLEMFDSIRYGNEMFFVVGINGETPGGIMEYDEIKQIDPNTDLEIMKKGAN